MAKIFVVERESAATVKAFAVKSDYQADLLYCEVSSEYRAKGDALWFYAKSESQATCKLCWVSSEYHADVKVYKVDSESKAKWKKSHAFQNRLG